MLKDSIGTCQKHAKGEADISLVFFLLSFSIFSLFTLAEETRTISSHKINSRPIAIFDSSLANDWLDEYYHVQYDGVCLILPGIRLVLALRLLFFPFTPRVDGAYKWVGRREGNVTLWPPPPSSWQPPPWVVYDDSREEPIRKRLK